MSQRERLAHEIEGGEADLHVGFFRPCSYLPRTGWQVLGKYSLRTRGGIKIASGLNWLV